MHGPLFSIVIPTRNRGALLRYALRSALAQTIDDFEIIVSNNCSTDATEEVLAEFADPRLRIVRPDRPMSMPDHWEFAFQFPRGEFVTCLCDDDALTPFALEKAAGVLRRGDADAVVAPFLPYFSRASRDERARNAMLWAHYTEDCQRLESAETLARIFSCRVDVWTPRLLNAFIRLEALERAREKAGRLFWMCPDFAFSTAILSVVPSWLMFDAPLRLFGMGEGIGASAAIDRGAAFQAFVNEFGDGELLGGLPVKIPVTANYIAETLLLAKEKLGEALAGLEIDRTQYFVEIHRDIKVLEANGVDVFEDRRMLEEALARETAELRARVASRTRRRALRDLRTRLLPTGSWLRRRAWQLHAVGTVLLRGDRWGFRDIVEAARFAASTPALGLR